MFAAKIKPAISKTGGLLSLSAARVEKTQIIILENCSRNAAGEYWSHSHIPIYKLYQTADMSSYY